MKPNSLIKTTALLMLVILVTALTSCAETASNATDDTTIDTTVSTEDVTVDSTDTTAPDETTSEPEDTEPEDTEPEDTTAKETEPARDKMEPLTPWEDESETPDEVITGKELEALVESADEAWGWLRVYNIYLDKDVEPVIYRETEYYPVADYKTLDEFRERLLECFSVSLVNRMINETFNTDEPLFIVENGVLMGSAHLRLTDVAMLISEKFYAARTGERTGYFVRPVEYYSKNNGAATVARDEHRASIVFEYGKWVFDSYPDFELSVD